jgi:hypothetical protein
MAKTIATPGEDEEDGNDRRQEGLPQQVRPEDPVTQQPEGKRRERDACDSCCETDAQSGAQDLAREPDHGRRPDQACRGEGSGGGSNNR